MAVDVEQHGAVFFFAYDVAVPEFVVKGLCLGVHGFFLVFIGKNGGYGSGEQSMAQAKCLKIFKMESLIRIFILFLDKLSYQAV
ncbi:hypothetical protein HMPREF9120_00677 [Neisseria sp. oral taxon 020 str. F0370]|nr:hypothetical protein HMPREF9120_00677 [Neisseria sp. oral taxon 020 str. F0370]